ncbi:hypothetical protein QJS10_CPB15g01513 [Acorus calamus]|uniref:Uncharacterized protein n=1 Tax=Acorus calamus TaxID=4465 RepID=A0AAV9D4B5_ACOCL|nr:hypothetical protein QJS10_CPB15g01513 [Acorus calamus]
MGAKPWKSFIELLKMDCMKPQKEDSHNHYHLNQNQHERKPSKTKKKPTLEDWIVSSPGFKHEWNKPVKVCPDDQDGLLSFSRYSFSSVDDYLHYVVARDSLSLERTVKVEEMQSSSTTTTVSCLSKRQGGKKRVSFRLPEEADIHVFYVDDFDCDE